MNQSQILRIPDFSALEIPRAQYHLTIRDDIIFRDILNQHRSLELQEGPACKGDYVLAEAVHADGKVEHIHIELGGKHFPEYEKALWGSISGQILKVRIHGEETTITVQTVKKVEEYPLTDASIAALEISGVDTLVAYRRRFIAENGEARAEKVFNILREKLIKAVAELTEVDVNPEDMSCFHNEQRAMIQCISGDADKRLMDAYECQSAEEADRKFFADNQPVFVVSLVGREMARRDGYQPTQEQLQQTAEFYGMIHDIDPVETLKNGLPEVALHSVYFQYCMQKVQAYYKSLVRFHAEGIESQAI